MSRVTRRCDNTCSISGLNVDSSAADTSVPSAQAVEMSRDCKIKKTPSTGSCIRGPVDTAMWKPVLMALCRRLYMRLKRAGWDA